MSCTCKLCTISDKLRWATISECKCHCHTVDTPTGHSSLCCAYPNGLKKDNPYNKLDSADSYNNEWYKEANLD